jgi:diadenosine tetraphosphate (Ap4A) HIT family hydrolase
VKGEIPAVKIYESARVLAFMDIFPISKGHILVIPKEHAKFMHQLSDESLSEIGPAMKKVANAYLAVEDVQYNILQNNGRLAHQEIEHVHFHFIPKPNDDEGLGISWPSKKADSNELQTLADKVKSKLSQ